MDPSSFHLVATAACRLWLLPHHRTYADGDEAAAGAGCDLSFPSPAGRPFQIRSTPFSSSFFRSYLFREDMGLRDIESTLPPGFRFYPSDQELVCHYLQKKVANERVSGDTMVEVDLHTREPWELPGDSPSRFIGYSDDSMIDTTV
ncbi:hypothetical protein B296_00051280 [Ensete ventricosum]|uniref:NAC domain-containing protein n=1 Tax=Ensete ventricosum TaxID=4639 RepID=A0A426YHA8_ENSVE|nr:hypothetical protein B296_00051280 [Ensete ventricosum]